MMSRKARKYTTSLSILLRYHLGGRKIPILMESSKADEMHAVFILLGA